MTAVNFAESNLKYYLSLHPEMLPVILFSGFVGWLWELKRRLTRKI